MSGPDIHVPATCRLKVYQVNVLPWRYSRAALPALHGRHAHPALTAWSVVKVLEGGSHRVKNAGALAALAAGDHYTPIKQRLHMM